MVTQLHSSIYLVVGRQSWGEAFSKLLKELHGKWSHVNESLCFHHRTKVNAPYAHYISKNWYLSLHFSHQFTHRLSKYHRAASRRARTMNKKQMCLEDRPSGSLCMQLEKPLNSDSHEGKAESG